MKKRHIFVPIGFLAAFSIAATPAPARADIGSFFNNLFSTVLGDLQTDLNELIASSSFGQTDLGKIAQELTGSQGIITPENIKSLATGDTGPLLESGENLLTAKLTGLIGEQVLSEQAQEHYQTLSDAASDNTQVVSEAEQDNKAEQARAEVSSITQNIEKSQAAQLAAMGRQNTALISTQEIISQQQGAMLQQQAASNVALSSMNQIQASQEQKEQYLEQAAANQSATRAVFEAGVWAAP